MDVPLAAVAVSSMLISAAVLGLLRAGQARRRTALRMLRGPSGGNGPPNRVDSGRAPKTAGNPHMYEGLRDVPMMLELVAVMLDSGAGIARSLELISSCAAPQLSRSLGAVVAALDIGTDWETAWRSAGQQCSEARRLKDALAFAALTGAPSSAILYAQAARMRREQFRTAEKRAAALGVKLVIPLGLCSLPAFICLGVVPVLLAMIPSAG
ncbi:type II secretion system F family protein [Arthrobacter sp. MA-N2]|uniref:type II secretion system F family protein n=1 Tax=Arthrobacter sp. MA-N2 TaxID=1101188 RepID=UPI000484770E|nr:type II secretion system F family protein [Arthrobacter sp. MA-N2]